MAFTYTTLKASIQNYLQNNEDNFVTELPTIVDQAEERILYDAQLPDFRKNVTGTLTDANPYLQVPTDFLSPYSLMISNSGTGEFLIFKEVSFIRSAYPTAADKGTPKYYALFEDTFFLIGPTPDANYAVELHYFYKPESIVTAGSSWLGTHAKNALLYGCLLEGYTFNKGEADMFEVYSARYENALSKLKLLAEGRNKIDSYRN